MKKTVCMILILMVSAFSWVTTAGAVEALLDGGGHNLGKGDAIDLSIGVKHTGSPEMVDMYLGLILPNGAIIFLQLSPAGGLNAVAGTLNPATWAAFISNINLPSGIDTGLLPLLKVTLTGGEPSGVYQWALIFMEAGTLNVIDFSIYSFLIVPFGVQDKVGTWEGVWNNTTFLSSGPVKIVIADSVAPGQLLLTIDLGGFVLGGPDPPPFDITATVDAVKGILLKGPAGSLGSADITIAPNGDLEGKIDTSASGIDSLVLEGTVKDGKMKADYTVNFSAGKPAVGTLSAELK